MSEETQEKTGFAKLKNQIIAGAGVGLTTLGTMFIDEIKNIVGLGDDEEQVQTEQVDVKQENNQSQSVNVTGPTIVVNIPEQKKDTVVKKVYVKPAVKKKEKEQEIDW
jgi:hypothetical protein